jgi:hypothetical protein
MNRFLVGSNVFFRGYFEDFESKDVDSLILEDEPRGYENVRQFHFKDRCIFQWRRMKKDEFIDLSLEKGLGMELGKFLVPEFARELEMDINDLEKLRPLAEKLDEKHLYEKVIYDAYIENCRWFLTDEQRIEAYRIYKECKEKKDEN